MQRVVTRLGMAGFLALLAGCGIDGLDSSGGGNSTPPPPSLQLMAGSLSAMNGSVDGTGALARFNQPYGVAVDSAANVYVVDHGNSTLRKISPSGVVSTFAGTAGVIGSTDGTGSAADFNFPKYCAVDSAGNVYVADTGNNTVRKISPSRVVSTLAGTAGVIGSSDGTGAAAQFNGPSGITVDSLGNVYVADSLNNTIRKITPTGMVTTLAGVAGSFGALDGFGSGARFNGPQGLSIDSLGNIYVADTNNNTVRKISPGGIVSTMAGMAGVTGTTNGAASSALFISPIDVAVDSSGKVYVLDNGNNTIRKMASGLVSMVFGASMGMSGTLSYSSLGQIYGIAAMPNGQLVMTNMAAVVQSAGL